MDEPWGLTGPEFMNLYWIAVAFAVVVVIVAKVRSRSVAQPQPGDRGDLSPYDLALLAAGPTRVEHTALAGLLAGGAVRVSRGGKISQTVGGPGPADPVQDFVYVRFRKAAKLGPLGFANSPLGRQMIDTLDQRGFITSMHRAARLRRVHWLFLVIVGVGIARLVNGLQLDRRVGHLVVALFITLVIWIVCRIILGRAKSKITPRGREALNYHRTQSPRMAATGAMVGFAVLGPIALYGLTAFPDEELNEILAMNTASASTSSSDGGGCGSGCGSSCGSSSSSSSDSSSSSGGSSCSSGSSCGGGGGGCGG
ncbi:TIGR04222 domain-containing protein [Actinokineospora alba]|uniref:TIGR04222 domain-containing protein n=1 Tax=Actinokineospora alba TaxID=504798 RepID=A0A1H0K8A5_9PSEU|nr:TIGR04222 domain-containing membrane protein [Actinokineospora alba]TDP68000.1 uncharacterized protein (TIGR04222 family) [Actinokineospora alba]SDH90479.1 TIGR04222 domain-containing protein [Actinokineospora alba]SDO52268.1 TIGR04222 domain-containing protein [Actinokineospora alba]